MQPCKVHFKVSQCNRDHKFRSFMSYLNPTAAFVGFILIAILLGYQQIYRLSQTEGHV